VGAVGATQDRDGVAQEEVPLGGQRAPARPPHQQRAAELALQRADGFAG